MLKPNSQTNWRALMALGLLACLVIGYALYLTNMAESIVDNQRSQIEERLNH